MLFTLGFLLVAFKISMIMGFLYFMFISKERYSRFSLLPSSPVAVIINTLGMLYLVEIVVLLLLSLIDPKSIQYLLTPAVHDIFIPLGIALIFFVVIKPQIEKQRRDIAIITDNIHEAVVVMNIEGDIYYINKAAEKMFGYTKQEIAKYRAGAILTLPVSTQNGQSESWLNLRTLTGQKELALEGHTKDNRIFPAMVLTNSIISANQAIFVSIIRDMTEQREAEQKLQKSSRQFRDFFYLNPEACTISTLNGVLIDVNQATIDLSEYTREELIGKNVKDVQAWLNYEDQLEMFRELLKTGYIHNKETKFRKRSGNVCEALYSAQIIEIDSEKMILSITRDITDRKEMEKKLKNSEALLKKAQEIASLGYWDWNIVTNDLYWSDEIYRIFGLTPQQFGASYPAFLETIHPDDRDKVVNAVNDAVTGRAGYSVDHRIVLPDGVIRVVHEQGEITRDEEGRAIRMIGTVHDVTERNRLEESLLSAKEAAENANRAKSDFLAHMSHEIRTPMNTTLGAAEMLSETELTDEQRQYVDMFKRSSEHLLSLINDILDISKIESGHMELEQIDFSLDTLCDELVNIMNVRVHEKNLYLKYSIAPDSPKYLIGDPHRLNQILINLVGNAVKFTWSGGITVSIEPTKKILDDADKTELIFRVSDTGIGIPSDRLDRIFQSFSQADISTTRQYGGTGLGLSISKKLAELMGGKIWVESKYGEGSTFCFTAVFGIGEKILTNQPVPKEKKAKKLTKDLYILLVDDSPDNREIIKLYLRDQPVRIETADNGIVAVEKVKMRKYDVILMDLQMPLMDGYEATSAIRGWEADNNKERTPIIALSANAFKEYQARAYAVGCDNYIVKPVKKTKLIEIITTI